mmetsp:Transcript_106025/g.265531  ORF Transcript_106025/g.265531 Transcript_106025/m.265531 type:complete len:213 (+) Transcript_106025:652-1290(+)
MQHAQQLPSRLHTTPPALDHHHHVLDLVQVPSCLDALHPALQLAEGPEDAWPGTAHVLLECGVQSFQQDQQVHGIHEKVQHAIALVVHHGEALSAHQLLCLLAEDRGPNVGALIAQGCHAHLGGSVVPAVSVEVAFPKALDTEIVQTIIASKGCRIVLALLAFLLWLDDVSIGDVDEHRLVTCTLAAAVHVLEALEAKVVRAIGAEHLRLLD